jgi:hypothetical protein
MTNNDLMCRELSVEELESIAAGGFWGSLLHAIEHDVSVVVNTVRHPIAAIERSVVNYFKNPTLTPGL